MRVQKYFIAKDQRHFLTESECMNHDRLLLSLRTNQQPIQPLKMHPLFTDNRSLKVNISELSGRMIEVKNLSTDDWVERKFLYVGQDNVGFVFVCINNYSSLENWRFAREINYSNYSNYSASSNCSNYNTSSNYSNCSNSSNCNCLNYGETYQYF